MTEEKNNKNLYQTGYGEIMLKNFLAGFSQKFGSWLVTLAVLIAIYIYAMPIINQQLKSFEKSISPLTKILPK